MTSLLWLGLGWLTGNVGLYVGVYLWLYLRYTR
jgi:hypothetical protein